MATIATIAKEAREAHAARREADLRALQAFSPKNFDNNPYLELQAQPPPAERIAA
jgi:hypothetical protein